MHVILLCILTLIASAVGTATGFGTSTIMIPVLATFVPVPIALLFVGVIHLCGDVWKVLLFRAGLEWKLVLGFGLSGIAASYAGASLSLHAEPLPLKGILGAFLMIYVLFLLLKRQWALPKTQGTAVSGGILSGLFAGFFGIGGAVRGAFLMSTLVYALIACIPVSFTGATLAKRFLDRLPQRYFRILVAIFLALVGIKLLVWP